MLNQRIIDIYRFVEKTISPSNLALEELFFYVKIKNDKKIKIYIKKPFKETENSQNFEGVNSMLMYLLNKESSDCS
ncbi:hypothetical protein AN169_13135 [Staphylococcus aureus]|nr:hypothetical protein AN169_13135 [Staphylococcus aureus]